MKVADVLLVIDVVLVVFIEVVVVVLVFMENDGACDGFSYGWWFGGCGGCGGGSTSAIGHASLFSYSELIVLFCFFLLQSFHVKASFVCLQSLWR